MLLDVRSHTERQRARDDARRRRGRGVRQGRAPARPRLPGRARRSTGSPATATRARTTSPSRASPASTSPSRGSRRRCSTRCASWARRSSKRAAPTSPRRTSARSCARSSSACARRREQTGRERIAIVGGVAANSELRAALPRRRRRAARALHRQRGDDRLGGALDRAGPVPALPRPRRVRVALTSAAGVPAIPPTIPAATRRS